MTTASAPSSALSAIGKGVGTTATAITVGVLGFEAMQVSQGEMDAGRFSYHLGAAATSFGVGLRYGGSYGTVVGLSASSGEFAYDTSKQTVMTLNGQWNNFVQSIINATMGGR